MLALLFLPLLLLPSAWAVKFSLQAHHSPAQKCLWNYAMADTLVVISVSAPLQGAMQRLDMEVVDGSGSRNIYQSKKGLKGETRMAVTTHADADLGVCFKNVLDPCESLFAASKLVMASRVAPFALSRAVRARLEQLEGRARCWHTRFERFADPLHALQLSPRTRRTSTSAQ